MRTSPITTLRTEEGAVWFAEEHRRRLIEGAGALRFPAPDLERFEERALVAAGGESPACVHVTVREDGTLGLEGEALRAPGPPSRLQPVEVNPIREKVCHKTSDRAFYEEAHRRARPLDDALLVLPSGELLETTIANLFLVREGGLLTPEAALPLLPGVARGRLMAVARSLGMPVSEGRFRLGDLAACEGAFLSNALFPVHPVAEVAGHARFASLPRVVQDLWEAVVSGASLPV